jgi:hypothetical protein
MLTLAVEVSCQVEIAADDCTRLPRHYRMEAVRRITQKRSA